MDFLSFVQKGVEKSNKCLAAIAEVDGIFENVNADLKRYAVGELRLVRSVSGRAQIESIVDMVTGAESSYLKSDRIFLSLKTSKGEFSTDVAGWKQRATGYPCILKFDGQELSCSTATHLINGISELLASVGFGNCVNNLTKQALESDLQKKSNFSETSQSAKLSLVNKGKASPVVAKAAAKPVAAKAYAKPAASKAPAKSATSRAAAKAGKPTASKASAKPEAPKASSAKPSASNPPAQPETPKAPVKPSVKSAHADEYSAEPNAGKARHEYRNNDIGDVSN